MTITKLRRGLLALLCASILGLAISAFLTQAGAQAAAADSGIYYYVNCGSDRGELSEKETALGMGMGSMNGGKLDGEKTGDAAWGHVAGTAQSVSADGAFDSFITGDSIRYEFAAPGAEVRVTIGYELAAGSIDSIAVNGEEKLNAAIAGAGRGVFGCVVGGASQLQVELTGTDVRVAYITVAAPEAKFVVDAFYNSYEAVVLAEVVDIQADCYTESGIEERDIVYSNFDVGYLNRLYESFRVEGKIAGTELATEQYVLVVPKDMVYFLNAGANVTTEEYAFDTEGVLGLELDGSGAIGADEPYFNAIRRRFPELLNSLPIRQNTDDTYGYMGDQQISITRPSVSARTVFETIMFPKRGTLDCDFSMQLEPGTYDIHIGTFSYWFARNVDIIVNGKTLSSQYEIRPANSYLILEDVTMQEAGALTVKIKGAKMYDEAMISFVAVTEADDAQYDSLSAPQSEATVPYEAESLTVTGLAAGAKLQVSNAANGCLLYEQNASESECAVDITTPAFAGVTAFQIRQINYGHVSEAVLVQKTDITGMKVERQREWTGKDLPVTVSAECLSGIAALEVKSAGGVERIAFEDGDTSFSYTYSIVQNGDFTVTLYSGIGASLFEDFTVDNIDKSEPALTVSLDRENTSNGKVGVGMDITTVSPVSELYYMDPAGKKVVLESTARSFEAAASGSYLIYAKNAVGKVASAAVNVATDIDSLSLLYLSYDSAPAKQTTVTFHPVPGFAMESIQCWLKGNDGLEKMIVNGNEMTAYENGEYLVEYRTGDNVTQLFTLTIDNIVRGTAVERGGVSPALGVAVGLPIGLVIAGIGVFLFIKLYYLKGKRATEGSNADKK